MDGSGSLGKLAEYHNGIANVRATGDVGIEEFSKEGAIGEALFLSELSIGNRSFRWAFRRIKFGKAGRGKGFTWFPRGFIIGRSVPLMGFE